MLFEKMLRRDTGLETANRLLAGLREWRGHRNVAMYLTGSVGMRGLIKAHGLDGDLLNDLTELRLLALAREEAANMLRALLAGSGGKLSWDDRLVEAVVDRLIEFHPSIIQFAFRRLLSHRANDLDTIERAFHDDIRPGIERNFFRQFTDRLRNYPDPLRGRLDRALAIVAASAEPVPLETFVSVFTGGGDAPEEVEDTVAILQEDGFINWDSKARALSLADRMVRAWWQSRPRA